MSLVFIPMTLQCVPVARVAFEQRRWPCSSHPRLLYSLVAPIPRIASRISSSDSNAVSVACRRLQLAHCLNCFNELLTVGLGIDQSRGRIRVSEHQACDFQTEFLADVRSSRVPDLIWRPRRDLGLQASSPNCLTIGCSGVVVFDGSSGLWHLVTLAFAISLA